MALFWHSERIMSNLPLPRMRLRAPLRKSERLRRLCEPHGARLARGVGWVLLETWLPLACFILLAVWLCPYIFRCYDCEGPDRVSMARSNSLRIVYEVYPRWRIAHPDQPCSRFATDGMADYPVHITVDPWGNPYLVNCLSDTEFLVISRGPDCLLGNDDDLQQPSSRSGPESR